MTTVVIENRTGNVMKMSDDETRDGHPDGSYPSEIQDGQVVSFTNVPDSFGSKAALVYRSGNDTVDHMLAWCNPLQPSSGHGNSVLAQTRGKSAFKDWDEIFKQLSDTRYEYIDPWTGFESHITITEDISGKVKATFTRTSADNA